MTATPHPQPATGPARPAARGVVPLRPLLPGEILDGAVTTMRAHPGVMLGLSAVLVTAGQCLALPLDYLYLHFLAGLVGATTDQAAGSSINDLAALRPSLVVDLFTSTMLAGLLTVAVSRAVLGQPVTVEEVWRRARPRLLPLFGLGLAIYAMLVGLVGLGVAPGVLLAVSAPGGSAGLGVTLAVLGGIAGLALAVNRWICWSLAGPALVLEGQPVRGALRRSAVLVKGAWWRVLGILLLATLVSLLVSGILLGLQSLLGSHINPVTHNDDGTVSAHDVTWLGVAANAAFAAAVQALVGPFVATVTALQYVDRRMRAEALDIELSRGHVRTAS